MESADSLRQELIRFCQDDKPERVRMELAKQNDPSFADKAYVTGFIIFLLVTMIFYIAWSMHYLHQVNDSLRHIVDQQNTAEGQAELFFKAVKKEKR